MQELLKGFPSSTYSFPFCRKRKRGQVCLLGEKMKQKKRLIKSLTEQEKEWLMEKRELEGGNADEGKTI
jgi:hypothetical protein